MSKEFSIFVIMVDIDYSFIRLRETVAEALNLGEGPGTKFADFRQVQLLPGDDQPYLQVTNSPVSLPFDSYQVFVVRACDGVELEEITSQVDLQEFTDVNTLEQFAFEITELPTDHNSTQVYLRFELTFMAVTTSYYTNTLLITNQDADLTTRFDYRSDSLYEGTDYDAFGWYQSIRLNLYFREYVSQDELTPYFQISRNQNINQRVNQADINRYIFPFLNAWTAKRLKRMLYGDRVYITRYSDSIGIRNYMVEAFEMPSITLGNNVAEATFLVDPDDTDTRAPERQIEEVNLVFSDGVNAIFSDSNNINMTN